MNRKKRYLLTGLLAVVVTCGCLNLQQPAYELSYYTLEYPSLPAFDAPRLPVVLKVAPFAAAPAYDTYRIVYRNAPFERNTYAYHRWQADPGDLVSERLRQDLTAANLFQAILPPGSVLPCDYRLSGTVDEFLEWEDDGRRHAVLAVTVTVAEKSDIRFHKSYRIRKPLDDKDLPSLVKAMSLAMAQLSQQVITDVYDRIEPAARIAAH